MSLYRLRSLKDRVLLPLAKLALRLKLKPNIMTTFGLFSGIASGWFLVYREILFALFALGLSVFCDALDGTIARKFHSETEFGLVFDSVADRCAELAVILGAVLGGIIHPIGILAIIGSITLLLMRIVSHLHGLDTSYVLFGRAERVIFISIGLIVPYSLLNTICFVVAGLLPMVSSGQIVNFLRRQRY